MLNLATYSEEDKYLYFSTNPNPLPENTAINCNVFGRKSFPQTWMGLTHNSYGFELQDNISINIPRTHDWIYCIGIEAHIPEVRAKPGKQVKWQLNLLHNIIRSAKLQNGNTVITEIRSEFLDLYSQLTQPPDYFRQLQPEPVLQSGDFAEELQRADLFMKLPFLPDTCSAIPGFGATNMKLTLELRPLSELLLVNDNSTVRYSTADDVELESPVIVKIHIFGSVVSEVERKNISMGHITRSHPSIFYNLKDMNGPIRGFLFAKRRKDSIHLSVYDPITEDIAILYGSKFITTKESPYFFSAIQPDMQPNMHRSNIPNTFCLYSYALDMTKLSASGSVNFSKLEDTDISTNLSGEYELVKIGLGINVYYYDGAMNLKRLDKISS